MKKQNLNVLQQMDFDAIPKQQLKTVKGGRDLQPTGDCTCWYGLGDRMPD